MNARKSFLALVSVGGLAIGLAGLKSNDAPLHSEGLAKSAELAAVKITPHAESVQQLENKVSEPSTSATARLGAETPQDTVSAATCFKVPAYQAEIFEKCRAFLSRLPLLAILRQFDFDVVKTLPDDRLLQGFLQLRDEVEAEDYPRLKEIIDELAFRLPNHPDVAKAKLMPLGASSVAEFHDHLAENLDQAIRTNPSDPDVIAAEMFLAVVERHPNIVNELNAYSAAHPKSGIGFYNLAAVYYQQGQSKLARRALLHARARDPHNEIYSDALAAMDGKKDEVALLAFGNTKFMIKADDLPAILDGRP